MKAVTTLHSMEHNEKAYTETVTLIFHVSNTDIFYDTDHTAKGESQIQM